jgi:ATP-dependent exoDNAse (exonuclease V) beta subunit
MARKSRPGSSDQLALDFGTAGDAAARHATALHAADAPVADQRERTQALDPTRSFIVQSPAGSGKTGLLIQRYLVVLAHARAPEEVLAITFTRKAAAEMRARVLEGLQAARNGTASESDHHAQTIGLAARVLARDRERSWGIEANPGRLQIMTIDALCSALTRRLPLLSGLGPVPHIEEKAGELYREAARATLGLLDEPGYGDLVAALLRHLDNDFAAAEDMLERLLQRRDQWLRTVGRGPVTRATVERALVNLARDRMARVRAAVPEMFIPNVLEMVRYAAGNLAAIAPASALAGCSDITALPGDAIEDLATWRGIAQLLLTSESELRKTVNVKTGFPSKAGAQGTERARREAAKAQAEALLDNLVAHQPFVEALAAVRQLPDPAYDDRQWRFIEALGRLLPLALAQLKLVFQQRGAVDFIETTLGAIAALGEADAPTDLALALDYRIQHLLIDEFQDTSYSHFELLQRLTAGWQPGDGRTLFLVGDPMQSIYRFREAEVALFLRVRERGIGHLAPEPLRLQVNFRSQSPVVEWVNGVFEQTLPEAEDLAAGAVPYSPSVAYRSALAGSGVEVHALIDNEAAQEPQLVLELIRRAHAEDPDGTVAVLVRSRSHLAGIVPVLKDGGIAFRAIDIEALTHRPVVRDLHALTRALIHPADRTAWLAVLRAPWCGLTLRDLEILAGEVPASVPEPGGAFDHTVEQLMHDEERIERMSADGRRRLLSLREALGPVLNERGRATLRRRVEGAWMRLGGPACCEDTVDLDDAQVFLQIVDELERGGDIQDLRALDERLGELYALPDLQAPERLQIMTIHKSKGLEFDTVIIAGLGRKPRADDRQLLHWLERPGDDDRPDLLLAAVTETGQEADPIYQCVSRLHEERQREEDARLLYVAVTRARRRAHLIGATQADQRKACAKRPVGGSLLERLWPALAPEFDAAARRVLQREEQAEEVPAGPRHTVVQFIRRLAADWQLPSPPGSVQWTAPAAAAPAEWLPEIEFSWAGETARHVGTVVHRFLQQIAQDGLARWNAERLGAAEDIARSALRAAGVPDVELDQACTRVHRALKGALAHDKARWVLGAHRDAQAEVRLTAKLDRELIYVAVDRTFVDDSGTRWIVDYKTGLHEGGDLEVFLNREQERYRPQLERYARVMRGLDGRKVRVALYFPLLQAWREWAPE